MASEEGWESLREHLMLTEATRSQPKAPSELKHLVRVCVYIVNPLAEGRFAHHLWIVSLNMTSTKDVKQVVVTLSQGHLTLGIPYSVAAEWSQSVSCSKVTSNKLRVIASVIVCVKLEPNLVFRSHGWRCHGPYPHTRSSSAGSIGAPWRKNVMSQSPVP